MRTQPEIDSLLQQLIAQYAGQRPDYYGFAGECLSLVKRWVDVLRNGHLNGPMGAPPANAWGSDYWVNPPELISELFVKQNYDPNAQYPAGSLFVNVRSHHIGILMDNAPGQPNAFVFQQNANPDGSAAHTGPRSKANIDGILVLKVAAPQPVVTHQITDYSSPIKYNVIPGKNEWDVSFNTFAEVASHPTDTAGEGKVITARAVLHIQGSDLEQYQYYLEDRNNLRGWNSADCSPYVAPPKPYVPPSAPVVLPSVTYYTVLPDVIKYYDTAQDAKDDKNAKGVKAKGQYIELGRDGIAVKLVKSNTEVNGDFWINDYDNKLPEVVAETPAPTLPVDPPKPVQETVDVTPAPTDETTPTNKPQYFPIQSNHQPVRMVSTNTTPIKIKDLDGVWPPMTFPARHEEDYTMYAVINGTEYWLPDTSRNKGYMFGLNRDMLKPVFTVPDFDHDGRNDIPEYGGKFMDFIETNGARLWQTADKFMTHPKVQDAKTRVVATIDGFKARSKK